MNGDTTLKNAVETVRRLNIGRATVPAGGPTDRAMRDAVVVIESLMTALSLCSGGCRYAVADALVPSPGVRVDSEEQK